MLFNETLGALLFCPIDLTLAVSGRVIIDTVKVYSFGRVKLKKHCTMIRPKGQMKRQERSKTVSPKNER